MDILDKIHFSCMVRIDLANAIVHQLIRRFRKIAIPSVPLTNSNAVEYSKPIIPILKAMANFDLEAYLKDNDNSIENRVKDAILYTYGDTLILLFFKVVKIPLTV